MYGISSEGTTTDLYTELFGPREPAPAPQTATAAAQPVQPVTATASPRQVEPSPAPVAVAQQQPSPQPEPEPDVPTAYGITANGPTTDLYTELFGPRRRDGQ
jgi:hypothetical protein